MSSTRGTAARTMGGRRTRAFTITIATAVVLALAAPAGTPASADPSGHGQGTWVAPASDVLSPKDMKAYKEKKLKDPGSLGTDKVTVAAGDPTDPIDQRILVIATNGDPNPDGIHTPPAASSWDWTLSTLTSALDYVGMPYDTYRSSTKELCRNGSWAILWDKDQTASSCTAGAANVESWSAMTDDRLWDGAHAYYSGVMLTDGALWYTQDGAPWETGLSAEEWAALWTFEGIFGVRMVSAFTKPLAAGNTWDPDYGMTLVGSTGGATATYTSEGKSAFPYVTSTLPISGAIYLAALANSDTVTATPILTSPGGVLGVIATYPQQANRQTLALTFDSARYFTHGQVLGYGLVNWVTKGQFLGFRKATLDPQIDDIFVEDEIWQYDAANGGSIPDPATCSATYDDGILVVNPSPEDPRMDVYRITGDDLQKVIAWQTSKQGATISKALKLSMPFNGEGTVTGYWPNDTLTSTARINQAKFKWINHSYDHPNLDAITYDAAATTIRLNNQVAKKYKFTTYSKLNFVQPDISGLTNPSFLSAAYDQGVRNLVSDTSRTGNPGVNGPNEGLYNGLDGRLLEVPRYPTNMYFNVTTREQWLALDNCIYPASAQYGHVEDYDQLLDREATTIVRYLLQGDNRPLMFHEANLRAYSGTHSVFSDLMDRALQKYAELVTVPITSPTMDSSAALMRARMTYNDALRNGALAASVVPGTSMTLTSNKAVTVPLTGFDVRTKGLTKETYAGQTITYVPLTAGVPRTILIR